MKKRILWIGALLLICILMCLTAFAAETVSVSDMAGLESAFETLSATGGTVKLTADFTLTTSLPLPANAKKITLDGDGHTITMKGNLAFNGDADIMNITFCNYGTYRSIPCSGHTVHFYDTVSCTKAEGAAAYPSIMAGYTASTAFTGGSLTIDGGTWQRVRGGNAGTASKKQVGSVTVNGGTFKERFQVGGGGAMASGSSIDVVINGGTFESGIVFFTPGSAGNVYADCTLTINGGTFMDRIRVADQTGGVSDNLFGSTRVLVTGGDFTDCTGFVGTDCSGMTSTFEVYSTVKDLVAKYGNAITMAINSTLIRTSTADPWLYTDGEYYYMTQTGSTRIALFKADTVKGFSDQLLSTNIVYDSAKDSTVKTVFGSGATLSGTWSPEVHYYSEEDFPGNSGWYMYLALRKATGDSSDIQMVVLKSITGEPDGPFGNIDGVANQSMPLLDKDGNVYSDWGCGQSSLTIPSGKYKGVYALWVAETGRGEGYGKFYQSIMIAKLETPWKLASEPAVVTTPTQNWEKIGASSTHPMVVEGGTAVYGDNGEIYLIYSGSGYWSNYGLGQITLSKSGGDYANPLLNSSWVKYENNPVFAANDASGNHYTGVNKQGAGHASFLKDAAGNGFFCYHAYPYNAGSSTATIDDVSLDPGVKAGGRNAYLESYYIDYEKWNGTSYGVFCLGANGDGKPAETHDASMDFATGMESVFTVIEVPASDCFTLRLDGTIGIRFILDYDFYLTEEEKATAYVRVTDATGKQTEIPIDQDILVGVLPAHMTRTVRAELCKADGTVVKTLDASVRMYCERALTSDGFPTALKTLVKAILNYGTYVQKYFAVDPDTLANAGLGIDDVASVTVKEGEGAATVTGSTDGFTLTVSTFMFLEDSSVRHYYVLGEGLPTSDRLTADFSIIPEFDGSKMAFYTGAKNYLEMRGIAAPHLSTYYTITLRRNGTSSKLQLKYSAISYAVSAIEYYEGKDENAVLLAKALLAYSRAADAYFAE